jgi:hypothetical protein
LSNKSKFYLRKNEEIIIIIIIIIIIAAAADDDDNGADERMKGKEMDGTGHVKRSAHRVWVGKPKGNRSLGRPRHRWEDNFKINLKEKGWRSMD